jgi:hypothetical protein
VSLLRTRSRWAIVVIALAAAGVLIVLPIGACGLLCGYGPSDERLNDAPRLVETRELVGLNESELEARIGPWNGRTIGAGERAYFLGKDDSCIDSDWLVVEMSDGTVTSTRIGHD